MVLCSPDWTNIGFSFILLTVNLFRHSTLSEHGLFFIAATEISCDIVSHLLKYLHAFVFHVHTSMDE